MTKLYFIGREYPYGRISGDWKMIVEEVEARETPRQYRWENQYGVGGRIFHHRLDKDDANVSLSPAEAVAKHIARLEERREMEQQRLKNVEDELAKAYALQIHGQPEKP